MQCISRLSDDETAAEKSSVQDQDFERPIMLELQFKDGRSAAFGYSYLYRVDTDGRETIVLYFMADIVTLRGQRLGAVADRLRSLVERRIVESDELQVGRGHEAAIHSILIESQGK